MHIKQPVQGLDFAQAHQKQHSFILYVSPNWVTFNLLFSMKIKYRAKIFESHSLEQNHL